MLKFLHNNDNKGNIISNSRDINKCQNFLHNNDNRGNIFSNITKCQSFCTTMTAKEISSITAQISQNVKVFVQQ